MCIIKKFGGLCESRIWGPEANSDCQEFEKLNLQMIELNARIVHKWSAGRMSLMIQLMEWAKI